MSAEHEIDEEIAASRGGSRWAVVADDWPDLPPEVIELLAAPVVVTAHELPEHHRPEGAGRRGYGECMPSFLAPAPAPLVSSGTPFAGTVLSRDAGMPRTRRARRRI